MSERKHEKGKQFLQTSFAPKMLQAETIELRSFASVFYILHQPFGGHGASTLLITFDRAKQLFVDDIGAQVDAFVAALNLHAGLHQPRGEAIALPPTLSMLGSWYPTMLKVATLGSR
jgi:hypothetical protein